MGFDMYHKREIANVLRATACASESAAAVALGLLDDLEPSAVESLLHAYRQGVAHALVSVGLALGLEPAGGALSPGPDAGSGLSALLWRELADQR
jgi:hypothetical protein